MGAMTTRQFRRMFPWALQLPQRLTGLRSRSCGRSAPNYQPSRALKPESCREVRDERYAR
jgi:hypothetical protein